MQPVSLRKYLAGHLVRNGLKELEDALNEPVKNALKREFPNVGDSDEASQYAAELQRHKEDKKKWEEDVKTAEQEAAAAHEALKKSIKSERKSSKKAATKAETKVSSLQKKRPCPPTDVWLRKARSVLGDKMKEYVVADKPWDTYTLVAVMCGFFDVIAPTLKLASDLESSQKRLLLHRRLKRVSVARTLRAHGRMPTENEALSFLSDVAAILDLCRCAEAVAEAARAVRNALDEAQKLKKTAYDAEGGKQDIELSTGDQEALLMYCAVHDFEKQLEQEAGRFAFQNGTVVFGERVTRWKTEDQEKLKAQKDDFKLVAAARHWLFHHTARRPKVEVVAKMGAILEALRGIAARNPSDGADVPIPGDSTHSHPPHAWAWRPTGPSQSTVTVQLELSAGGMSIPVPRETCLVGRAETIDQVKTCLSEEPARVLLHGLPGMGKDVVAAEVVRSEELASLRLQLQAWLQGSTDDMLRRQLVDLFETQMPEVFAGEAGSEDENLAAIRSWLETHDGWFLVVEDAGWATSALWKYIPVNKGRLLVTSQAPLSKLGRAEGQIAEGAPSKQDRQPLPEVTAFELEGLHVSDSLELLRKMVLFNRAAKDSPALQPFSSEIELQYICAKVNADDEYSYAPETESEDERKTRHGVILARLQAPGKKSKDRQMKLRAAQIEYAQLSRHSDVRRFLCEELGNVPLSVALCGQLLRSIGSVDDLMAQYRSIPLQRIDQDGRNLKADNHYLGAVRSVLLLLSRIQASDDTRLPAARRLMYSLALLPSRTTPVSLFCSDNPQHRLITLDEGSISGIGNEASASAMPSFGDAAQLLEGFGLTKEAEEGRAPAMHQLVQRIVREHPLDEKEARAVLLQTREALLQRLTDAYDAGDYIDTRAVLPCAEWWCALAESEGRHLQLEEAVFRCRTAEQLYEQGYASRVEQSMRRLRLQLRQKPREEFAEVQAWATTLLARSLRALSRTTETVQMLESIVGDARQGNRALPIVMAELASVYMDRAEYDKAAHWQNRVLQRLMCLHGLRHRHTATAMHDLACSLYRQGRHKEAAAMRKHVLQLRKQILSEGHPDISMAMGNYAVSLISLGRYPEAVSLLEAALKLERRSLPSEHPRIFALMGNLATANLEVGNYEEAIVLNEETLALKERFLPPNHPETVAAMSNLAAAYGSVGNHREAERLQEEVLRLNVIIFGQDHPQSALAKNNLALSYSALGDHKKAAHLQEQVLETRRRILHPQDPLIGSSMAVLGSIYTSMGRLEDAARVGEQGLAFLERVWPEGHPDVAQASFYVAFTFYRLGEQAAKACKLKNAREKLLLAELTAIATRRACAYLQLPQDHSIKTSSDNLLRLIRATLDSLKPLPSNADRLQAAKDRARRRGRR